MDRSSYLSIKDEDKLNEDLTEGRSRESSFSRSVSMERDGTLLDEKPEKQYSNWAIISNDEDFILQEEG